MLPNTSQTTLACRSSCPCRWQSRQKHNKTHYLTQKNMMHFCASCFMLFCKSCQHNVDQKRVDTVCAKKNIILWRRYFLFEANLKQTCSHLYCITCSKCIVISWWIVNILFIHINNILFSPIVWSALHHILSVGRGSWDAEEFSEPNWNILHLDKLFLALFT